VSVGVTDQTGNRSLYRGQLYKPRFLAKRFSAFSMPSYTEEDVTNALHALVNGKIKSVRKAALFFQIHYTTLQNRHRNQKSSIKGHISQQRLTPIEKSTLKSWIYRAAKLGAPITLPLVKILASEIQSERSIRLH
jgi:hypothetical protein